MNDKTEIEYAVVLTSCGRFDLLRRTVESFLRFADVRPRQFIVVEDSGDENGVRAALAGLDYPFEFVIRPPKSENIPAAYPHRENRQVAAIDAGYARVKTPLVFHCEDDWLFFRTGFIYESFVILQKFPKVPTVQMRGRDRYHLRTFVYEEHEGVLFFRCSSKIYPEIFCYGYNPGLRRMSDYRTVAPLSAIGDEFVVERVFKILGFGMAGLEIPAVVHLGDGRNTHSRVHSYNGIAGFFRRTFHRWRRSWHKRAVMKKWRAIAAKSDNLPELQK